MGSFQVLAPDLGHPPMPSKIPKPMVVLRPVLLEDLAAIFEFQRDADAAAMAAVYPRSREVFDAHWARNLNNPNTTARAILVDGVLVGSISCFRTEGRDYVGYWIDRAHWGRGIATRALAILLQEVAIRPLYARAARENVRSVRVLERCGFRLTGYRFAPGDERYVECEEAELVLD